MTTLREEILEQMKQAYKHRYTDEWLADAILSKFSPKVLSVEKIEEIIDQPIREYNMERLNIKGLKQAIAKAILEQGIKVGE